MKPVHLLPVGKVEPSLLEDLRSAIPQRLHVDCEIIASELDPSPCYHAERQQYHSSEILRRMQALKRPADWRLLGVTAVDLYVPILKYVFGEAQLGGPCALVSLHRLCRKFYGLDRDDALLRERLLKESIHELGHTLELHHCENYRCVMASAHSVEWIDLRESTLCPSCRTSVESKTPTI